MAHLQRQKREGTSDSRQCPRSGNEQEEVVQLEHTEIRQTLTLKKEFEGNAWSELWRTPGNRHRLIILILLGFFSQWPGNGLVS